MSRNEPVIVVEDGILDPLGHHWSGVLLKPHDELRFERPAHTEQQQVTQEIEEVGINVGPLAFCRFDGLGDVVGVTLADMPRSGRTLGSINREAGDDFPQHHVQLAAGVVAVALLTLADLGEQEGQAIDVASK